MSDLALAVPGMYIHCGSDISVCIYQFVQIYSYLLKITKTRKKKDFKPTPKYATKTTMGEFNSRNTTSTLGGCDIQFLFHYLKIKTIANWRMASNTNFLHLLRKKIEREICPFAHISVCLLLTLNVFACST